MKRKLLSGALALVMLAGCTAPVPDTQKLPDDGGEKTRVAYVPLDDRPVNTDRVEYLAGSLGYELVMPDAEAYRTRLDEQPLGESGLKYGDRAALYEWVLEQEESGSTDTFCRSTSSCRADLSTRAASPARTLPSATARR